MIRSRSNLFMSPVDVQDSAPSMSSPSNKHSPLASRPSKLFTTLGGILLFGVLIYVLLIVNSPSPLKEHRRSRSASYEQLTIVLNTFERHDLMQSSIDYYSQCDLVKYIYVVWSEKPPPPDHLVHQYEKSVHPRIVFNIQKEDSLNNRFKPLTEPHTDAVLSVDDDMLIPCDDLNLAYEIWRGSQRSLVGFMPRIHLRQQDGRLVYRCWWRVWWHGLYSIILTKAAIMHHDFFDLYTHKMPQQIRTLVDERRNCEDIAMQFLIANETSLPPIYVKGHLEDKGALNGISTSHNVVTAGHMNMRSDCLNDLEEIYHRLPLVSSHLIVDSAGNSWTNAPSTWFEYISSDLWNWA